MLALILACTIATPCIYIEPNPTLPGITNMAGGPDIAKDMTHANSIQLPAQQSNKPHPSSAPLTPPSSTPTPHANAQRTPSPQPLAQNVRSTHLRTYTVQPGDCLYTIGLHYRTTWQTLWAHNPGIMDPNLIWPGEVIALP